MLRQARGPRSRCEATVQPRWRGACWNSARRRRWAAFGALSGRDSETAVRHSCTQGRRGRMQTAPLGDAYVLCSGGAAFSDGVSPVAIGNETSAVVYVVRSLGPKALLGAVPDTSTLYVLRFVYVRPGQPAERAGIHPGDVVVGIDGEDVRALGEPAAEQLLRDRPAGTPARLLLSRAGASVETTLVVGRWQ